MGIEMDQLTIKDGATEASPALRVDTEGPKQAMGTKELLSFLNKSPSVLNKRERSVEELMREYDTDGDGQFSREEVMGILKAMRKEQAEFDSTVEGAKALGEQLYMEHRANSQYRLVLAACIGLLLCLLGSMVGITWGVVEHAKESHVSDGNELVGAVDLATVGTAAAQQELDLTALVDLDVEELAELTSVSVDARGASRHFNVAQVSKYNESFIEIDAVTTSNPTGLATLRVVRTGDGQRVVTGTFNDGAVVEVERTVEQERRRLQSPRRLLSPRHDDEEEGRRLGLFKNAKAWLKKVSKNKSKSKSKTNVTPSPTPSPTPAPTPQPTRAPSDWECSADAWSDGTNCDCDCGDWDPDCDDWDVPTTGCESTGCTSNSQWDLFCCKQSSAGKPYCQSTPTSYPTPHPTIA